MFRCVLDSQWGMILFYPLQVFRKASGRWGQTAAPLPHQPAHSATPWADLDAAQMIQACRVMKTQRHVPSLKYEWLCVLWIVLYLNSTAEQETTNKGATNKNPAVSNDHFVIKRKPLNTMEVRTVYRGFQMQWLLWLYKLILQKIDVFFRLLLQKWPGKVVVDL